MKKVHRYKTRDWKLRWINFYPPFLGAGIRVNWKESSKNNMLVELKLRPWNKNYIGTQFGGSIYSMCDPFYMVLLSINLGNEYIVVDKGANIEFLKPGSSHLYADFCVEPEKIEEIKAKLKTQKKLVEKFDTEVLDQNDTKIARVRKELYIRKRGRLR